MPSVKLTRKVKHSTKGMTIPQLRHAFQHIQDFVHKSDFNVQEFRREWKKTFHKEVSEKAARDYLAFLKEHKSTKTQSGGMAPLDYQLRPGVSGVYGQFPDYVSGGFGAFNRDSFNVGCGTEDISPRVPADMGSNLVKSGGGLKAKKRHLTKRKSKTMKGGACLGIPLPSVTVPSGVQEFLQRPITSSSPPTMLQSLQGDWKGGVPLASGDPTSNSLRYIQSGTPSIYTASSSSLNKVY
jgi:hypothetical protein